MTMLVASSLKVKLEGPPTPLFFGKNIIPLELLRHLPQEYHSKPVILCFPRKARLCVAAKAHLVGGPLAAVGNLFAEEGPPEGGPYKK
jgi:hypothetical protein